MSMVRAVLDISVQKAGRRRSINIIGLDNGSGLSVDAGLLRTIIEGAGSRVRWSTRPLPEPWQRRLERRGLLGWTQPWYDINIFLERFHPVWFPYATQNILVPNPEWFADEQLQHLAGIDEVFCKTQDAMQVFKALGKRSRWVGFTGRDFWQGTLAAVRPMRALHLAGRSEHKGTRYVLESWRRHPEWPELTVVQRPLDPATRLDTTPAGNIRFVAGRLSEQEIQHLRQEHPLWILPSEVEGYGQTLVEGLSVGAIVMTTDSPPMNEIVQPDRGVLVRARHAGALQLGSRYAVEPQALDDAVCDVLGWTLERRLATGTAARKWFLENDVRFRRDFTTALENLNQGAQRQRR